jgi:hypothetical protein
MGDLALAACVAIGAGGVTLAHPHTGKGQVKVTQLSQRDNVGATVLEVTFGLDQEDLPHRPSAN